MPFLTFPLLPFSAILKRFMKKLTHTFLIISLLAVPLNTFAMATIQAGNSFAGVGTELLLGSFSARTDAGINIISPAGIDMPFAATTDMNGNAHVPVNGSSLQEAGLYQVTARTSTTNATTQFTILPGGVDADTSDIETVATHGNTAEIAITLRDRYANSLSGRPVLLISSRADDRMQALTTQTDSTGVQHFLLQAARPGHVSLSAIDLLSSTVIAGRGEVTLGEGAAIGGNNLTASIIPQAYAQANSAVIKFIISAPKSVKKDEPFTLQITASDSSGNPVPDYAGTVYISAPKDPGATLPGFSDRDGYGELKFLAKEAGVKQVSLGMSFAAEGTQDIAVEDGTDAGIKGKTSIIVAASDNTSTRRIRISAPAGNATVGSTVTVSGEGNAYSNIIISGGDKPVQTDTDATGHFSVAVPLAAGKDKVTLTVKDEAGLLGSATVTVNVDTVPPPAGTVSLSPITAPAESSVMATLQLDGAATGIASIEVEVAGQTLALQKNPVNETLYQTNFAAPSETGKYSVVFRVKNQAGNASTTVRELTVTTKGLSKISNLRAASQPGGVKLDWNASADTVEGYNILIGDGSKTGPNGEPVFDRNLQVVGNVTSAIVDGLDAGTKYAFAVAAVKSGVEGPVSSPVLGIPSGIALTVTPGAKDLLISWEFKDAPELSGYLLEFGVSPTEKTERRIIAAVQSYRLEDLLPRAYYFTLTPITVSGQKLDKVAARGEGTPGGTGFHPSAGDPVDMHTIPVAFPPTNAGSGLPPVAWFAAIGLTVLVYGWYRRRSKSKLHNEEFIKLMETRYRQ
ncbi:MAG: hypothetical protein JWM56_1115 [Candidatus Peribacteria bacterium]|nr:hypothetical protein [Candidatus Peribacteria bacterium]